MCVNPSLDMPEAVLGLGGNVGARRAIFRAAEALLHALPGCSVLARSQLYETPPLGPPQPDYLNAALRVRFEGTAEQLFVATQRIELLLGRERRERWGARTLDIDLLHWSEGEVHTPTLQVPHAELGARAFALAPLLDVAPELGAHWASTLALLGGPPPLATPAWPTLRQRGSFVHGDFWQDDSELASQLIELLAQHPPLAQRLAEAAERAVPVTTHGFTGPSALFDGAGESWLKASVDAALQRGFAVKMAAIVGRDDTTCAGIMLGHDGLEPSALGPLQLALESGEGLARRVKMRVDVPERGLDSNGSGTM